MPERLLAFVSVCLLMAVPAIGQETTGRIQGRVLDQQDLPVPGVLVSAVGAQGSQETTTETDGRFSLPFLTPGPYALRAELQGFKPVERKDITVGLGQTVDVKLALQIGGFTETVTVVGTATPIDTTSTTTGAVIDSDFVRAVPVGRRISDVAYMAPGVSDAGTVGRQNPSIAGGTGLDNQYVIDGVNVTNQGYGALGSYSIYHGSLGNATPFDFVKEVQVKTGGYEAEFGQSTGGVVNVITKSGGNDYHGSFFGYSRPSGLEGTWKQFQSVNGTVQTLGSKTGDGGFEGGGPIIKNRLFFFGAVDWGQETRTFQAPEDFTLFTEDGYDRTRDSASYALKGTLQFGRGHRIDASFFGDPSSGDMGPQRPSSLLLDETSSFSEINYGGHNQTVRYSGSLNSRWLVEAAYGRALNSIEELPLVDEWRVIDQTVSPQGISGGLGFYEAGNRSVNNQWSVKSTNFVGAHQVKYGLQYDDVSYSNVNQRTGPPFVAPDGRLTATGAQITVLPDAGVAGGKYYRVTKGNFNSGVDTDQQYLNTFVQDSWAASDRLTLNLGLRYEQETLSGNIVKDFSLKNNWAPRLGATYGSADGKTKFFGNWGRFYARLPNDVAVRALSGDEQIGRADYYDAALTRPIPDGVSAGGVTEHFLLLSSFPDTIDPDAKLSYTDEVVLGFEREVMPNTALTIRYIHRNVGRVLEDLANVPMVAFDLGLVDSAEYVLTNPSSNSAVDPSTAFLGASFDDPVHTYHAVEVVLNRRFSNHWGAMGSYRWSRLRGNFEGFYRDDNGQSDPGWTSLYDFPTNDPSYTAIGGPEFGYEGDIRYLGQVGILPLDRPHQFKAFGNYAWDAGLSLGLALNLGSGRPLTPLAANPNYTTGGEIPTAPRGSGIETIDGFKTRSPFQSQVDLQASYEFRMGMSTRSLTLLADIFNLFNQQRVTSYDTWTQLEGPAPNPDFGNPVSQIPNAFGPQFQAPLQVRIGARFSF